MVGTVRTEGLGELIRAFGRIDKKVRREITGELRQIAATVADAARDNAVGQGLVDSGLLIRSFKTSVRGSSAFVRNTATRNGFPYPAVYEYGNQGVRAFLRPAAREKRPAVERALEQMLDRIVEGEHFN